MKYIERSNKKSKQRTLRLLGEQTPFAIRESFNQLRTNIMYTTNDHDGCPVYAITSAEMSVGKSTVSANIAVSFTQLGKKVLLIDADMRRPAQHFTFGYDKKQPGLSDLLAGVKTNDEECMNSPMRGLTVITSGIIPPNPAELMHSKKFVEYMEKWRYEYDIIFVDCPPAGVVADPIALSSIRSGFIIVAMANRSDSNRINATIKLLKMSKAKITGIILNATSLRGEGSKYSRHYGYKRGYYKYNYYYGYKKDND